MNESLSLAETAIKGVFEKKAENVVLLNLQKIPHAVADYFVICTGNSERQVDAISDSVEEEVKKETGEKPWHTEGRENAEWILLDYVNVVVHVFKPETREFYDLEGLWADAEVKQFEQIS